LLRDDPSIDAGQIVERNYEKYRRGFDQGDRKNVLVDFLVGPVAASNVMTAPLCGSLSMPPLAIEAKDRPAPGDPKPYAAS
jgi:hypothetical protein